MNNADKSILDKVKTDLFQILFNHNSAYYPDLEWRHQLGKDKNVSECGNLREAFMEIKKIHVRSHSAHVSRAFARIQSRAIFY